MSFVNQLSVAGGLKIYPDTDYPLIQVTDTLKIWDRFWVSIEGILTRYPVLSVLTGVNSDKELQLYIKHLGFSENIKFYSKGNAVFIHLLNPKGSVNESVCIRTDSFTPVIVANGETVDESYTEVTPTVK